jgi:hypothetical protein
MASAELKLARERTKQQLIEAASKTMGGMKDIIVAAVNAPLIQVLIAAALIEVGQRIKLDKEGHQLITEAIGNTLDGILLTTTTLEALSKAAGPLANAVSGIVAAVK